MELEQIQQISVSVPTPAAVFRFQWQRIKNNRVVFLLVSLAGMMSLYIGYLHNSIKQAVAYLVVMWLCSFFIDFYALWKPSAKTFPVRQPKRESFYFFLCAAMGILFLLIRFEFVKDWQHLQPLLNLAWAAGLFLFVFPIGLAAIMLLLKYKPAELGMRWRGFIPALFVIAISALTNRFISPESLTWDTVIKESGGIANAIFTGLIAAGLSEEFFRVIGQTRLAALFKNAGMGWFVTTVIWAFMHAPKWYGEGGGLSEALLGSIRIIPIGLMWGYMTYRMKSILPSVLIHGTNFWGLQNF